MKKEKAFVILTPGFPNDENDSTVLPFLQTFVLSFCKLYPETKLVIISFQFPYISRTYNWHGAEIIAIGGKNKAHFFRLLTWIRVLKSFIKTRKKYHVRGIFSLWLGECSYVGQWLSTLFDIKHISWLIGQDAKAINQYLSRLTLTSENVIAMSTHLAVELNKTTHIPSIQVVSLGVDTDFIDSIAKSERAFDIIGVGWLSELKNYSLFVELIEKNKIDFPTIKACIIGEGDQQAILKELIQQKQLSDNIQLMGLLPHSEVIRIMKSSSIFLHTSYYEGQATVFVEALYCGMNVVCFDVGRLHSKEQMFICSNEQEMLEALLKLLTYKNILRKNILLQSMDDTVKTIVNLY
jgi:glycosyltransferase involved in cell wall biosynthesis